jgi:hypothetical protein
MCPTRLDILSIMVSEPSDLAGVRLQHAEDDPHGGGLAGAVGADEAEHLPFGDGERQTVEGDQIAVLGGSAAAIPTRRPTHPGAHPMSGSWLAR